MTTYTITTPVNIDSLTTKTGSDTYNINGGALTVDQHTRYGLNQNTSACMGNIAMSASLGGTIEFNSTKVRLIAYTAGSGVVPAYNTTISQGGASALLMCVYSSLTTAPVAVGGAMPATGFILVKQWNSVSFSAGALTGITATSSGADRAGFLEIVGVDALTATVNRLNTFKVVGDYFDFLGVTTSGSRATTYQIPTNGSLMYLAGVEVETGVGTDVYEFYPCASARAALVANIATDAVRGKYCWISTGGLVRFGNDGTNSTGGYLPAAGLKIRIPNIFFQCCLAASLTANVLPNATLATRYEFSTTLGGVIDIEKASFGWYLNLNQPFSVRLVDTHVLDNITLTECASPINWSNVGVGTSASLAITAALNMSLNFAGGTMDKCTWTKYVQGTTGYYATIRSDCAGFTITGEKCLSLTKASNATSGSCALTRIVDSSWSNTLLGAGRIAAVTCTNVSFTNTTYYDNPAVNTLAAIPMYAFDLSSNCNNVTMDGVGFGGLSMCQPYSGILNVAAAGCANIKLRNIGTYAAPVSLGAPRVDNVGWTRATTVATVTSNNHGFAVNDEVYVVISSDIAAIVVGLKTVTGVTTNTFTFTCLNAGAASGTVSFYGAKCATLFALSAGAAANGVSVQRVYVASSKTNLYTADNSSTNVLLENVYSDCLNAPLIPFLNGTLKNVSGTFPLTAQSSVYGTHWFNGYSTDVAANTVGQSWARSSTTVTVTSNGHALRTATASAIPISVTASSAIAAVPLGVYSALTALTSNTFNLTGVNSGATSGTLTYRVGNERIGLAMNEATTSTASVYTIDAGTTAFTSAGGLYMPVINDQITFTTPDYILGQSDSFPIFELQMLGGTLANYHVTYQLDKNDGNGFSDWKNLAYSRTGAGGSSGSTNVTMTSTTGVAVNDYVFGTGISGTARVVSITNGTTIVVSVANTATVSGTLRFNQLPYETGISASAGIKMKWRIKTVVTNSTAITGVFVFSDSTNAGRAFQYPLDTNTVTFTGLPTGTDVVILSAGTSTILASADQIAGTSFSWTYSGSQNVDVGFIKQGYIPFYIRNLTLTATDSSIPVSLFVDRAWQA